MGAWSKRVTERGDAKTNSSQRRPPANRLIRGRDHLGIPTVSCCALTNVILLLFFPSCPPPPAPPPPPGLFPRDMGGVPSERVVERLLLIGNFFASSPVPSRADCHAHLPRLHRQGDVIPGRAGRGRHIQHNMTSNNSNGPRKKYVSMTLFISSKALSC